MRHEAFVIDCEERSISGVLHLPDREKPPVVITCHGLFSSKESDKFTAIAARFAQAGLAVIRFDFSGCGQSTGSIADTTVSRRLAELSRVVRFARDHAQTGAAIGLLGSSLGGFVALLGAAGLSAAALSVWATPYSLPEICQNIPPAELKALKQDFFDDARRHDLAAALPGLSRVQVLQGKCDEIVPWQHAQEIYRRVDEPKELQFFPAGDHTISSAHDRSRALEMSLAWLSRYLS
jgi:alpha-beta hydrolase superfamily lysophospholipase